MARICRRQHRSSSKRLTPRQSPGPLVSLDPKNRIDRKESDKVEETKMIQTTIGQLPDIGSVTQLEQTVNDFIEATITTVEKHMLLARPSLYSKRWFTPAFKIEQTEVNRVYRRWQESCTNRGKEHPTTIALFTEMYIKRREWT
jgi:hypothetical protein